MVTKEQERKALEQITNIIAALGSDSYIGTALEGCLEIAADNIENDFACSMKDRYETELNRAESLQKEANRLFLENQNIKKELERITEKLEKELEWKDYTDDRNVNQAEYQELAENSETVFLSDQKAKQVISDWFGFSTEKITIRHEVEKWEINRHHQLREVGKIERKPAYNSTDWYYIRFDCCGVSYEVWNDDLRLYIC